MPLKRRRGGPLNWGKREMSSNAGKTVAEILKQKRAGIKNARLPRGSPSWDDIMHLTWEEIEEKAQGGERGFRTFQKLLSRERLINEREPIQQTSGFPRTPR
jgi:hypothetical protein